VGQMTLCAESDIEGEFFFFLRQGLVMCEVA
jgi:hypothetical protein